MQRFPAVVATGPGPASRVLLGEDELPEGDVTVEVAFSSLNYKDALALLGRGKVVRSFPMTLGIDLAGRVVGSRDERFAPGDEVLVTGCGLGETHPGGFSTLQRVHSEWLVPLPEGLDLRHAMALGTAGLTAMLAVEAIESGAGASSGTRFGAGTEPSSGSGTGNVPGTGAPTGTVTGASSEPRAGNASGTGARALHRPSASATGEPAHGAPVLVTGAAGGVGSVAVALLARVGCRVSASTGRSQLQDYLLGLGAAEVLERSALATEPVRPLQAEHWAGVVDSVGGATLANAIAQTRRAGTVAACGLAGSSELATTVFPFILRGVRLAGIDSTWCSMPVRLEAWQSLAAALSSAEIDSFSETRPMSDLFDLAGAVLAGDVRGRVAIETSA